MRAEKVSFEHALNDAIRDGAAGRPTSTFRTETASLGSAAINLDRALQITGEFDDEALALEMRDDQS